ncbi:protein GVQW3 [Trichonephila clavipes]|uniref:Protein GVQW3 n=1 Tax=Trichonephila clavipes TaxID=2585209 RepID=A0A8X6SR81_TRICX|nr:protein GVQW3 [Trichonephila clavipes]
MEKRAVIKLYTKLRKSASETYPLMKQIYGDCCLSRSNVFLQHKRFLVRSEAVKDDRHSGRSISYRVPEIIEKKQNFVVNDLCESLRMLADSLNTNKETIRTILHKNLGKTKVFA